VSTRTPFASALSVIAAVSALGSSGCVEPPRVEGINVALGTLLALGHAATLASAAVDGDVAPCVDFDGVCPDTGDCAAALSIDLAGGCAFPLDGEGSGALVVDGVFSGGTSGFVLTSSEARVDGRRLWAPSVTPAIVERSSDGLRVIYVMQGPDDVFEGGPPTSVDDLELQTADGTETSQKAFVIDIDVGGTPGDPSDDVWSIDGGGQKAGTNEGGSRLSQSRASVQQVALADVVVDVGACRKNPIGGTAVLNEVDDLESGAEIFAFHPECDGRIDLAVGVSAGAVSTVVGGDGTVALDLLR